MQFDPRAAKLLKPGEYIIVANGLRLVATESTRAWTYRHKSRSDGRMKQVKLGLWPAMSLSAAIAEWERLRGDRDLGRELRPARKVAPVAGLTVADVCDLYVAGHIDRVRKPKGAKEVRRMFDTMLGDAAGIDASSLTRAQAFDLIDSHAAAPVQAAKLKAELGAAWDYATDAGRLPESATNWWRLVMRGRLRSSGKSIQGQRVEGRRALSADEVGALIRWLPNFSRIVCDALTLYLWTGMRGAEIMSIEASELRREDGVLWLTMPKSKTKNARHKAATDLRVPLIGRADVVVARRLENAPAGFLFPSDGKSPHVEQKVIQTAVHYHQPYSCVRPGSDRPRLPVTHWSPHDLRRTVRTLLSSMGCPHDVAEAVLGHMQHGVAGIYNRHSFDEQRLDWLRRLDSRLEELAADRQPA